MAEKTYQKTLKKFIKFVIVGLGGALIQLGVTYALTEYLDLWYLVSLSIAIVLATLWNFSANLRWTFRKEQ